MELALVIVAIVVLTLLTLLLSRMGASKHPEELNSHAARPEDPGTDAKADRPAGPGAEPTGVRRSGEPGLRDDAG